MLTTSEFESSEHYENPPNLLIWFYIFEIKNKIKNLATCSHRVCRLKGARCIAGRYQQA